MGNTCGGILREPCLSDTDPRYDPNANFDFVAQDPYWSKSSGLAEYTGTNYYANGTIQELLLTVALEGLDPFPISGRNVKLFSNYTIEGTRAIYSSLTIHGPAAPAIPQSVGWVYAGSSYGTSSFELDGSMTTSPFQFVLQGEVWMDGPVQETYIVADKGIYSNVDSSQNNEGYSLITSCLDDACDSSTIVNQIYTDDELRYFTVYRGRRIKDAAEFAARIEATMEEYRVPAEIRSHAGVISSPWMYPDEDRWCGDFEDPSCSPSPYSDPETPLKAGAVAGFAILAVVVALAFGAVIILRVRRQQAKRYRDIFAKRVAQTITVRAGAESLTPELLKKEFETIDTDSSGKISKEELWAFLSTGKAGSISRSDFDALWSVMDADDSGSIDFLEFCGFLGLCHDEYENARNNLEVIAQRVSQRALQVPPDDELDDK